MNVFNIFIKIVEPKTKTKSKFSLFLLYLLSDVCISTPDCVYIEFKVENIESKWTYPLMSKVSICFMWVD